MSVKERDPLTGHLTTGHEWDGITELNTRVPQAVWFFIIVTHVWALVVWILMPAWPLVTTYTKGLRGVDQREQVESSVIAANASRADWAAQVDSLPFDQILANPVLRPRVMSTGHQLFGDNCAGCHGREAAGGPGFPSLVDRAWLWGGEPEAILETIRVGINSTHPDTRISEMLAFGRDGMVPGADIRILAQHVRSFSGAGAPPEDAAHATELFIDNCASCHGDDGQGDTSLGAPNLTDEFWIYGGGEDDIYRSIWGGRHGWMPAWEDRLSGTERKILATYLHELARETGE